MQHPAATENCIGMEMVNGNGIGHGIRGTANGARFPFANMANMG